MAYEALNVDQRGGVGPNGKESLTLDEAAAVLTRAGLSWGPLGQPVTVTYAYRASAPGVMPSDTAGFSRLSFQQIEAVEKALDIWEQVAGITFQRVGSGTSGETAFSNDATILIGNYRTGEAGASAFAFLPGDASAGASAGDIWINSSYAENFYVTDNGYGFLTLLHEIGHAIGLLHPSDYDEAGATYGADADYFEDSLEYSIMSYFDADETGAAIPTTTHVPGPLIDDIAAAQRLYGPNRTINAADTTYGYTNGSTTGPNRPALYLQTYDRPVWGTVVDSGGIDTFDFSQTSANQTIDLTPGSYSDIYGAIGSLSIFPGTIIENAIGGAGKDLIIGNAAANVLRGGAGDDVLRGGGGDDRLVGDEGDDVLTGGAGADVFAFVGLGLGSDVVSDFEAGDRFDLDGRSFTSVANDSAGALLSFLGGAVRVAGAAQATLAEWNARVVGTPAPGAAAMLATGPVVGATRVFGGQSEVSVLFSGPVSMNFLSGLSVATLYTLAGRVVASLSQSDVSATGTTATFTLASALTAGEDYVLKFDPRLFTVGGQAVQGSSYVAFDTKAWVAPAAGQFVLAAGDGVQVTTQGYGQVVGSAGTQDITVRDLPGRITFDASFNAGLDRIHLSGSTSRYTLYRSGSSAVLSDGDTSIVVPVGVRGTDIVFSDGTYRLCYDTDSQLFLFGGREVYQAQSITTTPAPISVNGGDPLVTGAIDPAAFARLVLVPAAKAVAGGTLQVFGTAGAETVQLLPGSKAVFDASFNAGGDAIMLPGVASIYSAVRSGSSVVLTSAGESYTIPLGTNAATLRFADGERALLFDTVAGAAKIGGQVVGTSGAVLAASTFTAASLDRDDDGNLATAFAIDASTGNIRFTDDAAVAQNVRVTGFAQGDSVTLSGNASDYLISASGGDVTITGVVNGRLSTTVLAGIVDPAVYASGEAGVERALGYDFLGFAA